MKKVSGPRSEHIENVSLYLDDLDRIEECFSEIAEDLTISIAGYELETIAELRSLELQELHAIEYQSYTPYIRFSLYPYGAKIYISDDTPALRGTFEKIKAIVKVREQDKAGFKRSALILNFLFGSSLGLGILLGAMGVMSEAIFFFIGAFLFIMLAGHFERKTFKDKSTIHLRDFGKSPSFWEVNKDRILLIIITASITAIITTLITFTLSNVLGQPDN